ncbi:hypothetical protein J7E99_35640 [Streptomyces sp. ISL-44]|uniref:hypothetical protein n=1 Tax=Streptomyces sp. ISL-44 TaxID=2819184 RepID=UPI001BE6FA84|nr:hypothetical protein [Streptomyces sp. ISL-44]MBT2545859.1 hypothetical protein [Streptomyces sp. ISL-44]
MTLGIVLVATSGCSAPEPPEPTPDPHPVISTSAEITPTPPDPDPTPPDPTPTEPEMQWSVPDSVVGAWCGGANDTPDGHWTYGFTAAGEVAGENQSSSFYGHVVTEGDVMTFYVEGSDPFKSTWSVGYEEALGVNLLYLNGFSYFPGSCDS